VLEARGIKASEGHLNGDVRGEVEKEDDGVIVIRRIHVIYRLKADESDRETIERAHGFHADRCPVYRTLKDSIEITTEFVLVDA
jgi:uncharacterized OsmC-like protein